MDHFRHKLSGRARALVPLPAPIPPPPPPPPPSSSRPPKHMKEAARRGMLPGLPLLHQPFHIVEGQEQPSPKLGDDQDRSVRFTEIFRHHMSGTCAWTVTSNQPIPPPKKLTPEKEAIFEVVTEYPLATDAGTIGCINGDFDELSPRPKGSPPQLAIDDLSDKHATGTGTSKPPSNKPPKLPVTSLKGKTRIILYSAPIIRALTQVMEYYPSQDFLGETVVFHEPFPFIAHHWDELVRYRDELELELQTSQLVCSRDKLTHDHLGRLLDYFRDAQLAGVEAEAARHARGKVTWNNLWLLYQPGIDVILSHRAKPDFRKGQQSEFARGYIVHSVSGGTFGEVPSPWVIAARCLRYNGHSIGWEETHFFVHHFRGEMDIHNLELLPAEWLDLQQTSGLQSPTKDLATRGKTFFDLIQPQCRYHSGKLLDLSYTQHDGRLMIDTEGYFYEFPHERPRLITIPRDRTFKFSTCDCVACHGKQSRVKIKKIDKFVDYHIDDVGKQTSLTDHQYFLLSNWVHGYCFELREWLLLAVENLSEPRFKHDMIDTLVMESSRIKMLKALSQNFIDGNPSGKSVSNKRNWSADFVEGRGSSLIFLLHGKPGVGKTYTAECIAEYTKRPLVTLTCADLGKFAGVLEEDLECHFQWARRWGAILLIDEAEVFMVKRSRNDTEQNRLVAIFLRALELYDGILFLTTSCVGHLDDAFLSRVHVKLYYPPLRDEGRIRLWKNFINKLIQERGAAMSVMKDAMKYIESSEIRSLELNGREIRNAVQTAVALADFEAIKGDDGRILLESSHISQIVNTSQDFKLYLKDLHQADEAERARRDRTRLDDFMSLTDDEKEFERVEAHIGEED